MKMALAKFYKSQHIRKKREFQRLFEEGEFARGKILNLWVCESCEAETKQKRPKLGVIVSLKAARKAVNRNLWKRRIREAFRKHQSDIKTGRAVLVQARRCPKIPPYEEIRTELKRLLWKTNCIQEK